MPLWQAFGMAVGCVAGFAAIFGLTAFWMAGPQNLIWVRLGSLVAVIIVALTITFWLGGA